MDFDLSDGRRGLAAGLVLLSLAGAALPVVAVAQQGPSDGEALYRAACGSCHGADGTGALPSQVAFDIPLPDFTDCSFATREPDADWFAVTHGGGPARGFARMMPAFGEALTDEEMQAVLGYVRTMCGDPSWPRGELNLPRAMFTEKAYPEDEAVWTVGAAAEGLASVTNELVYERRFGARNQFEIAIPYDLFERSPGEWSGGLGDIALGVKRALFHDLRSGTIFSAAGEVILPTGDEDDGVGGGVTIFEPFLALGQVLPADAFLHVQAGAELLTDRDFGDHEGFWRAALGKSFVEGLYGRTWSPMVEILGSRDLVSGAETHWDIVPQFQVTLNTRQHLMANAAVRVPLDDASRTTQVFVYFLWDWFDGGLRDGW